MKNSLIIFLWIVHISALLGLSLGYTDFFLEKSPLTMLYLLALLAAYFPLIRTKTIAFFTFCFTVGLTVEWIGVHTGWLFGNYTYGNNFGPKLDGIPYLIGTNWALLTLCTHEIGSRFFQNRYLVSLAGSSLMVLLDFFLEQICDYAGFWSFDGSGAGVYNYLCWFVIAYGLHLLAFQLKIRGDLKIASHLYIVQLIFAAGLWIIISTT